MVGIGTALLLLGAWLGFVWWRRREIPRTPWFLRAVAVSGVGAILALWFGWIVTEVGRQPWIVQGYMRTEEAVTEAQRDLVRLRRRAAALRRRWAPARSSSCGRCRAAGATEEDDEAEVPYGPPRRVPGRAMSSRRSRRGDPLDRGDALRALRRRRFRRRALGPDRRRRRDGRAAAGADPALADPRLGGQPRLADLHPRRPLDRLPGGLRRDHVDAVRADRAGRAWGSSCAAPASPSASRCAGSSTGARWAPPSRSPRC